MLVVSNITKRFRPIDEPILRDISFTVNGGECIGLIGPNGSGKTTLIKAIMGETMIDSGSIQFTPPNLRIGYLSQGLDAPDNLTIRDILFPEITALDQAEQQVEELAAQMAIATDDFDAVMEAYSDALERLETLSQAIDISRGEQLLAEFGLGDFDLDTSTNILSGGQKTRLGLAAVLVSNPQLLILDEPTNHLDIVAIEWLENWLQDFSGGVLLVSHDRTFMDSTVDRIVALDGKTHTAKIYEGNYRDYVEAVRSQLDKQWSQWRDQQVEIARLENDARRTMAKAQTRENATKDSSARRLAKKVAKQGKAKEKRLERYLASEDRVDKPQQSWSLKLDFAELPMTGQDVISTHNLSIGYHPSEPLLSNLDLVVRSGERVVILGPNGHGKSTLLKTIIGELPPLAGSSHIGASVKIGYLAQEQDILDPNKNALETLLSEVEMSQTEARSFLHYFLFAGNDVFRSISDLSFGERVRLMLSILVARGANLLVLDEPINHLDVTSREQFEQSLSMFQGSVLAIVHDRYFVERFATTVWHIENKSLTIDIRQPIMA